MFDLIHGRPESLYFFSLHYSQPDTNFRLPGRRNLELIALRGTGKDMKRYSQRALGASWDTVLLHGEQFYLGFSVGVYLKDKIDDRINAQFTFGEKFFLGYRFPRLNLEFFLRHFSTGYLTTINRGYNFVGVAAALNY